MGKDEKDKGQNKSLIDVQDSAAKHINYRGEKVREIGERYYLPAPGKFILYNEMYRYHSRSGCPDHYKRGIGLVRQYSRNTVQIEYFPNPKCSYIVSFQTNDFHFGRFRYVTLKEDFFAGRETGYDYNDLDIENPHEDLAGLFNSTINLSYSSQHSNERGGVY